MIERIGANVERELSRLGPAEGMAEIVKAWPHAVGEAIARQAWPARLARDGTLHVSTSSSLWAFELTQLEDKLLERLRVEQKKTVPKRLRFAPGRLPEATLPEQEGQPRAVLETTPAQAAQAAEIAAELADAELRARVARAAAASLARAASGRGF